VAGPLLSIVLVVFRDQAYLRECVSSILEQSLRDVELVAVDDASPDHAPEILDELAERVPRLSVRRLEQTVSLGDARNLTLEEARGEYLWFVAATDRLPAGALAAVAERLRTESPDVLVVDQTRTGALGEAKPGPQRRILEALPAAGTFTLDEQPGAVELGIDLRGQVFRRAFLVEHGLRFAPGGHGYLAVTYPALLAAERIAVLPRVCYERFDPPNAAKETQVHGTLFDVFGQYDTVFTAARAGDDRLAARRGLLAGAMLRHYLALLPDVPPRRRREFFARASESFRRHAAAGGPVPRGRRARLLARGNWTFFRALGWTERGRRALGRRSAALRRLGGSSARALRRRARRIYYRGQLRAPIEQDLAVFAAYWYRGYSCNPRAIYEKLRELAPEIRAVWIVAKEHGGSMPPGVEHVVAGTRDYYRLIARARYFVNNVNFPNEFVKREGTIHVQTHHGTPLKTMGLDLRAAFTAGQRMNFELLLRRAARWDYSISANPFSTLVWERAYPTRYESLEVGYPRNDVLVNATEEDVERVRGELGLAPGQQVILFAPTHREYLLRYRPTVDLGRLAGDLGPDYTILLRLHYFYGNDPGPEGAGRAARVLDVSSHPSIEELCLAADVLLTDYSSVMFDYAVLDRPIVVHAPDWDVYRTLRGTYFDLLAEPPGVVTAAHEELVAAFRSGAVGGEEAAKLRAAFRARFCSLEDGRAAERVVRKVFLAEEEAPAASRGPVAPPRARIEA
jgi:CDP-glycerol glycerophosphotransferase